ncbi:uncharacterized protein FLJ37310-like [Camelus ferus]|uniref:Uncharacterized protein FLJ37310-like n=1 Tax=Camelus ferus TaxID=419612 RepID=A0A8B8RZC3_CAMFR|nr:uncharacterized protein FLJ37310-like [Camelus ferus]
MQMFTPELILIDKKTTNLWGHQTRPRGHESQSARRLLGPAPASSSAPSLPPPTRRSVCQAARGNHVRAAGCSAVLPSGAGRAPSGQRRRLQRRQGSPSGRRGVGRAAAAELRAQLGGGGGGGGGGGPKMVRGQVFDVGGAPAACYTGEGSPDVVCSQKLWML